MTIEWNSVTRFSQAVAIVLFVAVFGIGFWLGSLHGAKRAAPIPVSDSVKTGVIGDASYQCATGKSVHAVFYEDKVTVMLSDGRTLNLSHTISGSGARYASEDDATVFWNKGQTAFITEGGATTFADCTEAPIPL